MLRDYLIEALLVFICFFIYRAEGEVSWWMIGGTLADSSIAGLEGIGRNFGARMYQAIGKE